MDINEYFREKQKHVKRIYTALTEKRMPGHPPVVPVVDEFDEVDDAATKAGAAFYATSVRNRDRNSTAGQTMLVSLDNGCRLIADGTHQVATETEIARYLQKQRDNKLAADAEDFKNSEVKVREVVRVEAPPKTEKAPAKQ